MPSGPGAAAAQGAHWAAAQPLNPAACRARGEMFIGASVRVMTQHRLAGPRLVVTRHSDTTGRGRRGIRDRDLPRLRQAFPSQLTQSWELHGATARSAAAVAGDSQFDRNDPLPGTGKSRRVSLSLNIIIIITISGPWPGR